MRISKKVECTCKKCRTIFYVMPSQIKRGRGIFCSRVCMNKYQKGVHAPSYVVKVKKPCKQCGKEFEFREKQAIAENRKIFCSLDCMYKSRRVSKVKLVCEQCGNIFEVFPSSIKYNTSKFCSKKCGWIHNSGNNHFRYIGATSAAEKLRKSPAYRNWRTSVFIRDNRQCVLCGSKVQVEADHILPRSLFPELTLELSNGRTLCHNCHSKTDSYMNPYMKREHFE